MLQERRDTCCSSVLEDVSGDGLVHEKGGFDSSVDSSAVVTGEKIVYR